MKGGFHCLLDARPQSCCLYWCYHHITIHTKDRKQLTVLHTWNAAAKDPVNQTGIHKTSSIYIESCHICCCLNTPVSWVILSRWLSTCTLTRIRSPRTGEDLCGRGRTGDAFSALQGKVYKYWGLGALLQKSPLLEPGPNSPHGNPLVTIWLSLTVSGTLIFFI